MSLKKQWNFQLNKNRNIHTSHTLFTKKTLKEYKFIPTRASINTFGWQTSLRSSHSWDYFSRHRWHFSCKITWFDCKRLLLNQKNYSKIYKEVLDIHLIRGNFEGRQKLGSIKHGCAIHLRVTLCYKQTK